MHTSTRPPSKADIALVPMTAERLQDVLCIENSAYSHPWSSGNFADSLRNAYWCPTLQAHQHLLGYMVVMAGAGEAHLLNITVAPAHQGRGLARMLLDALVLWSRGHQYDWVWLEVRASNERAQNMYRQYGFAQVGRRANYYPGSDYPGSANLLAPAREDALVMSYKL